MKRYVFLALVVMLTHFSVTAATETVKHWNCDPYLYQNNMTIIGAVSVDSLELVSDTYEIGAFCGNECRGSELLRYYTQVNRYLVFMTIYGEYDEEITLRLYDHAIGIEIDVNAETFHFETNAMFGMPTHPYLIEFFSNISITAVANPIEAGVVEGTGLYAHGETVSLVATPNTGWHFDFWTEDGIVVSQNASLSFTALESRNLVANFSIQTINIFASVEPHGTGSVSGSGSFDYGTQVELTASPSTYYVFDNWTENGVIVSTEPTISFIANVDRSLVAHFRLTILPELHVTNIAHSELIGGQQATITWTVRNDGEGPTPNGALWHDRVWLSVESRVAADDNDPILLGTFDNLTALNPGEYYTQTQNFTIPIEIMGEYFLFVMTDAYDAHTIYWEDNEVPLPYNPPPYIGCLSHHCPNCINVADNRIYEQSEYEHGEGPGGYYNDNFFYELVDIGVPVLPDLQVTSIITPEHFYSGSTVSVTATISNQGENFTLTDHWVDALFIASDPNFNSSSTVCIAMASHSGSLGVGQSYQVALEGQIPLTMFGEAYFFVYTDCYEQVYEHVLNHNNISMSEAVNIILSPPADLEPSNLSTPIVASTGEAFTYSFKVYNNGAGNPNVSNWIDMIYLSQNADTLDSSSILLKTSNHYGGLQPGAHYSINENVALPAGITSGTYYLYAFADASNAVFEYLSDGNNLVRSEAFQVTRPDLQITQISVPEQITAGYPINLCYTLTNTGEGAISNKMITDKIYISASGTMADTIRIAAISRNVNLPSGQDLTVICNELAPNDLFDGTFYLIVKTDCADAINESEEDNNTISHHPMTVIHRPLPDLQPISLTIPSVIQAGEVIPVDFDVTNIGDLDLLNGNCPIDVYATWENHEILCPAQSQLLPLGNYFSIGTGQSIHFVRNILVPPTVTSACSTFELIVNKGNLIAELDTTNNVIAVPASVLNCPLPDLSVSNITTNQIQSGTETQISFTVNNNGDADFEGYFSTTISLKSTTDTIPCPLLSQVIPNTNSYTIPTGATLTFTQNVLVPPMVNNSHNCLYIVVDEENIVLETDEDNNTTSMDVAILDYPFDLQTTDLQVPETVWAGETTSLTWTVKNIGECPSEDIPLYINKDGNYTIVQGEILPRAWSDKVFVSDDEIPSNDDIELCSVSRTTVLHPNGTYTIESSVTIPYSNLGAQYLLCISDANHVTYDSDTVNNIKSIPLDVQLGELPDLRITTFNIERAVTCNQAYWMHYTVTNDGERATQQGSWTDAFYIGEFTTHIGAISLGSKIHHGTLESGESYTDSIEFIIPSGLEGDYFLIGYTDKTNLIFEDGNEDNNVLSTPIEVRSPAPCDLIAVQPEFPSSVVSGSEMTVTWEMRNTGMNPAVGRIRNAVYLSTDASWSSDDLMLGYADIDINIAFNEQQSCSISGTLTGFCEGNHYVIVKANILNALNESTYENNICVSMLTTAINYPTLGIGESTTLALQPEEYVYYKLEVGTEHEGQTLLCHLESPDAELNVSNGVYLSHENVPSTSNFDYGSFVPYNHLLEIMVPSLEQGTYYLLVKGTATQAGNPNFIPQNVVISTSILNFEILNIDADHGANTGSLTTKITGAKFDSIMDFRLVQGSQYLPAEKVFFSNSTETYTTFDLAEMPLGTFAVEAELPGGIITIKPDAFTIEEGLPAELGVNVVLPASVRNGNTFSASIEYGNIGTTDLNVIGFVVISQNGHPIGLTAEDLLEGKTQLTFNVGESNGNLDVMRPGYRNTKTIMVKANHFASISLAVYPIRKQY